MSDRRSLVLTIDDDLDLGALIAVHVGRWGHLSHVVGSAEELRAYLDTETPDLMLMDVMLGDTDGSRLILEVKKRLPEVPVIMITGSRSIDAAVRCMKHGAADYITKPLDFPRLERAVREALEVGRLAHSGPGERAASPSDRFQGLLGASPAMLELFGTIEKMAPTDVSALVLGETGTGKELVARTVHRLSSRTSGPFVAVNAAAMPHELIESALFGHEKGAFTGAHRPHMGYCEQAHGGTLFLDEIGEMGIEVQAKLLRFLQDHVVQRVGSRRTTEVDVRVLAATNIDPLRQIAAGKLREDLYYRLRVITLRLPSLRERGGDIALLAKHFLDRASRRHGRQFLGIAPDALERLEGYSWPGNVRDLENVIEEITVLNDGELLECSMLPSEILHPSRSPGGPPSQLSQDELSERLALLEALERTGRSPEAAAELLGVSRATIYRKIKKFGL